MKKLMVVLLGFSVLLNAILVGALVYQSLMGCAEVANGKVGVLKQDVGVGVFGEHRVLFKLPKGLVVRDASASGADWFEPHRFRLVITSDHEDLVDFNEGAVPPSQHDGEYYSAVEAPEAAQNEAGGGRER